LHRWRRQFGGTDVTEAKRLRALQRENAELKRLVGDLTLDNRMLKDILEESGKPRCQALYGSLSGADVRGE
jgi:putative transposase